MNAGGQHQTAQRAWRERLLMIVAGQPDATRPGGVPAQFTAQAEDTKGRVPAQAETLAVARCLHMNSSRTSATLNILGIAAQPTCLLNVLSGLLAYCHQPEKPSRDAACGWRGPRRWRP